MMSAKVSRSGKAFHLAIAMLATIALGADIARAQTAKVEGTLATKEKIELDFKDETAHFFAMVRWEGTVEGNGPFSKAKVQYYGVQNIFPNTAGSQSGFISITKSETDIAYLKWSTQSSFLNNLDGSPLIVDNGTWTIVSGTGQFKGLKGSGPLKITVIGREERKIVIEGNLTK